MRLDDLAAQLGFRSADALFEVVGKDEYSLRHIEALLRPAEPAAPDDDTVHLHRSKAGDSGDSPMSHGHGPSRPQPPGHAPLGHDVADRLRPGGDLDPLTLCGGSQQDFGADTRPVQQTATPHEGTGGRRDGDLEAPETGGPGDGTFTR